MRIQTSILPRDVNVAGLEIAATMRAATEVGGDYYDVIPVTDGCWMGIGDVAGHGLGTGLVMLMMQSGIGALARKLPDASPRDLLLALNAMLVDNVRQRLGQREHATLTLLRYRRDGTLAFAGAHEEILILRAATGRCERLAPPEPSRAAPSSSPAIYWCSTPTASSKRSPGKGASASAPSG
jgi:sigma-B regulation protein RsbU (phosphoserine phosphatase)